MDIDVVKKLIKKYEPGHRDFIKMAEQSERYYNRENDIKFKDRERKNECQDRPLRNADNRIASNFHRLLVDQKASYIFTSPPLFDVSNDKVNTLISDTLGDKFEKICIRLCAMAANTGVAWIYYWSDTEGFKYTIVDSKQITPIFDTTIDDKLIAVLRSYEELDDNGKAYCVYEYYTSDMIYSYKIEDGDIDTLHEYECYNCYDVDMQQSAFVSSVPNPFGRIPFIPFYNNSEHTRDLDSNKDQIDTYDKVYSGFLNDLEDIQEVIFILSGYESEDLSKFLSELKMYKTVKLGTDEEDGQSKGDLQTLTIDIPVEARKIMLEMTRKSIFEQGMGIDPDPQNFGNSSGAALGYLYSLLELKAGATEVEFKSGFSELVRAICNYYGVSVNKVIQTWTRTKVRTDSELCEIAKNSVGIISNRTIVANHPWVENTERELQRIKEEELEEVNKDEADMFTRVKTDETE